jgi:hypothetical protein
MLRGAHEEAKAKGLASRLLQHDIDSAAIVNLQILDVRCSSSFEHALDEIGDWLTGYGGA